MPWMSWKLWSGVVTGARVRVPATPSSFMPAFGPSEHALSIKSGAIGRVCNILPRNASKPVYVHFSGPLNLSLAAEVVFRKSENSELMWKDFYNARMKGDDCKVVICYPTLDTLEIEYRSPP
jgi:hypothetical protein